MRTALTELLGVRAPLVGFNRSPGVVAAVTNAGGFGVLAASAYTPEELDAQLSWIEDQVGGRPYGVDLLVPAKFAAGDPDDLIASLRGRMTVIISSHILPEIEVTCDRVLIINQGRIVAQGTPADLRREIFGHSSYELELAGNTAELGGVLLAVEKSLTVAGETEAAPDGFRRLTLRTTHEQDLGGSLLRELLGHGFRVRSLTRAHPTLEDLFLAATRRSWDAVAAPPPRNDQGPMTNGQ